MKLLSRIVMVCALLGVLAYGSYAFGMYVLSAKLFGDNINSKTQRDVSRSTSEASAVTRQTGWKGNKPRVEVKVLPSDEDGLAAPLPAYADEDGFQKSASPPRRDTSADSEPQNAAPPARLGKREFDSGSPSYSLDDDHKTRKRSSRRRRKSSSKKEKPTPASDDAQVTTTATPSGDERRDSNDTNRDSSSRDNSSRDSSGRDNSSNDSSSGADRAVISDRPSRPSETPRETSRPSEKRRRRSTATRPKTRDSSPVPRPEGSRSGGGDSATSSPVPQPE